MNRKQFLPTIAWIAGVALIWPVVHELCLVVGLPLTERIPSGPLTVWGDPWPDWFPIVGYAVAGVGAFVLVFGLRRFFRAPKLIWVGVALRVLPDVILFLLAFAALAGGRGWLSSHLIAKGHNTSALSLQLAEFFGWWVWYSAFPLLGAWFGSRVATKPRVSDMGSQQTRHLEDRLSPERIAAPRS